MNLGLTYFLILISALAGPLALSFDKKVAFYKQYKFVFPAMLFPAVFYIIWDWYFTREGIWSFNEKFITGIKILNLPIEEILFFFVVPYCCVFIYTCIRSYFPAMKSGSRSKFFLFVLAMLLAIAGILFKSRNYTLYTFTFCAGFIFIIFLLPHLFRHFHIRAFLISYLIILFPFLIVNGFLTAMPVVLYNDAENLGIRIYTIPVEDIFYGMLLIMMNIAIFENLRQPR